MPRGSARWRDRPGSREVGCRSRPFPAEPWPGAFGCPVCPALWTQSHWTPCGWRPRARVTGSWFRASGRKETPSLTFSLLASKQELTDLCAWDRLAHFVCAENLAVETGPSILARDPAAGLWEEGPPTLLGHCPPWAPVQCHFKSSTPWGAGSQRAAGPPLASGPLCGRTALAVSSHRQGEGTGRGGASQTEEELKSPRGGPGGSGLAGFSKPTLCA